MAIVELSPTPQSVADCKVWLQESSSEERNMPYRQFWSYLCGVADHDSEEANQYWAAIFAIEDLQQYQRGEVNAVRYG